MARATIFATFGRRRQRRCLLWASALAMAFLARSTAPASAQLLLRDDFDGTGNVDTSVWRIPFGEEGTFLGRTQLRLDASTDIPQQGVAEASAEDGLVAEIQLNTFSSIDPGNQFLGQEFLTKRNFARGGGLAFEGRLRLLPPATGGLVNGFFAFDVSRDTTGTGNLVRDEIDHELLSNQAVAGTHDVLTNVWNDGPFTGPGAGGNSAFHDVAGLDLTEFHNYKVTWAPGKIQWLVDGALVRTQTTDVPDDPMKIRTNLWAPDSGFAAAYDAALQPAALEANDQVFKVQVDHIEIQRIQTATSANLLGDPSFENDPLLDVNAVPTTTTGAWFGFNSAFIESTLGDPTRPVVSGSKMFKAFGPFKGAPDASGAFQNVAAQPGQEFEASVFAQSSTTANSGLDPIAGTQNFATVALSFLDASGAVLQEAQGDPGNLVDSNGQDFPLLDGRDPNLLQDEFVQGTVNAVAPAGTAFARVSLFFIQLNNEGGAVYYDDAFLGLLSPALVGDMDIDGDTDFDDIGPFVLALNSPIPYLSTFGAPREVHGDTDADGDMDFDDIPGFVAILSAPKALATIPEPSSLALGLILAVALAAGACRRGV